MRMADATETSGRPGEPAEDHLEIAEGNGSRPDGRQLRGARTRRAIFDAYVQLLHEGADPPRMEQIAERAGVGTRTVYNQFRDLEGLRTEVGSQLFREWAVYALGDVPAEAPRSERLQIFLRARTRFLVRPRAVRADGSGIPSSFSGAAPPT